MPPSFRRVQGWMISAMVLARQASTAGAPSSASRLNDHSTRRILASQTRRQCLVIRRSRSVQDALERQEPLWELKLAAGSPNLHWRPVRPWQNTKREGEQSVCKSDKVVFGREPVWAFLRDEEELVREVRRDAHHARTWSNVAEAPCVLPVNEIVLRSVTNHIARMHVAVEEARFAVCARPSARMIHKRCCSSLRHTFKRLGMFVLQQRGRTRKQQLVQCPIGKSRHFAQQLWVADEAFLPISAKRTDGCTFLQRK